jgi:hypothetical protein
MMAVPPAIAVVTTPTARGINFDAHFG